MEHLYRRKTGYDEQELLDRLPPALSKELLDHLYRSQLAAVAIFKGLPEQVIAKLCFAMKPYKALKSDYIYREGEVCREFFIIEEGQVRRRPAPIALP